MAAAPLRPDRPARAPRRAGRLRRALPWTLVVAALALALLGVLFADHLLPESSPASRGAVVAARAGCAACHGPGESAAPRPDPARATAPVDRRAPELARVPLDPALLETWIRHGTDAPPAEARGPEETTDETPDETPDEPARGERAAAPPELLAMPAYGDVLEEDEIAELVAHLVALAQGRARAAALAAVGDPTELADPVLAGEALARRLGCFACHGELGQGGTGSPGSQKGYVPGFFGRDFEILTGGGERELVLEWIDHGVSEGFVASSPVPALARRVLARQALRMPAYESVLSAAERELLVDYCLALHGLGILDAAGLLAYGTAHPLPAPGPDADADADPETLFETVVAPLLEARCVECHGAQKQKSGYRLDRAADAFAGGEIAEFLGAAAIAPGAAAESLVVLFVEATEADPEREVYPMPPDGGADGEPVDAAERAALRAWIDAGAPWPDGRILRLAR